MHEDGIESAVRLPFGDLYYRGKTLTNEDGSVRWRINGIENSRAYIGSSSNAVDRQTLAAQCSDHDGDNAAHFLVWDYGILRAMDCAAVGYGWRRGMFNTILALAVAMSVVGAAIQIKTRVLDKLPELFGWLRTRGRRAVRCGRNRQCQVRISSQIGAVRGAPAVRAGWT